MKGINRLVSIMILTAFLLNTALPDYAFALAPASRCNDLGGVALNHVMRIEAALRLELAELKKIYSEKINTLRMNQHE